MFFTKTDIEGVVIIEPQIFEDSRGYFYENYNKKLFKKAGIDTEFVQDNQSYSTYGTLRGLHFQKDKWAQAKLVRVIKGRVLDVVVDIRKTSSTFGKYISVELTDKNRKQLFISRGLAHGFVVLSDDAIFSYKCDNFYNKNFESGIIYRDPKIAIDWKVPKERLILTKKDATWPTLQEYIEKNK